MYGGGGGSRIRANSLMKLIGRWVLDLRYTSPKSTSRHGGSSDAVRPAAPSPGPKIKRGEIIIKK